MLLQVQSLLVAVNSTSSAMFRSNVAKFTPLFEILFHVVDRILELHLRENITFLSYISVELSRVFLFSFFFKDLLPLSYPRVNLFSQKKTPVPGGNTEKSAVFLPAIVNFLLLLLCWLLLLVFKEKSERT